MALPAVARAFGVGGGGSSQCQREAQRQSVAEPAPNKALEPTRNSLRSCLAAALARGSPPAFGAQSRQEAQVVSWARELPDIRDGNGHRDFTPQPDGPSTTPRTISNVSSG